MASAQVLARYEHVVGLDVAVDDPARVGVLQSLAEGQADVEDVLVS